jgi:Protein of unknown function (DUF3352)
MTTARVLVLGLLCAILAGCASSSTTGGSDDPAALVAASAPLYAEATLQPGGELRDQAEAALGKVLRANDVDAWLGNEAGAALTSMRGKHDADYVVVIASKDDAKAADAVGKAPGDVVTRSYKGVDYRFDRRDGTAAAVIDHYVIRGTENGVKSSIDASNGKSLADADGLRTVRAKVAQDRVGLFYADPQALVQAIAQSTNNAQVGLLLQAASGAAPRALGGAVQALPHQLRIDAVSIGAPASLAGAGSGAGALAALPAGSWLGLGVADLGQTLDRLVQTVANTSGLSAVGVTAALSQFRQQTGLDLRQDVLSWMDDAGVFVAGTSRNELRGALVVKSSDPAKTQRTIDALRRLVGASTGVHISALRVPGADAGFAVRPASGPRINVGLAGDKFVVAVGNASAFSEATRSSGATLGTSSTFTEAASKLGNGLRPSLFLDFPQVVKLIDAFAGNQAEFQMAKPYLQTFGAVAAGGKDEGDGIVRYRFAVTLR